MRRSHQMLMAAFMSTQNPINTIQDGTANTTKGPIVTNNTLTPVKIRQVSPIVKSENTKKRDKLDERQAPTKKHIISKATLNDSDINNDESG